MMLCCDEPDFLIACKVRIPGAGLPVQRVLPADGGGGVLCGSSGCAVQRGGGNAEVLLWPQ